MFPSTNHESRFTIHASRRQRGFSIVTAIFLMVVLALLGAFIVSVTGLQQSSQQLDVQGVRAYQAARAGIEWGACQVLDPSNTLNAATCTARPRYAGLPRRWRHDQSAAGSRRVAVAVHGDGDMQRGINARPPKATATSAPINDRHRVQPALRRRVPERRSPASGYVERQLQATLSQVQGLRPPRRRAVSAVKVMLDGTFSMLWKMSRTIGNSRSRRAPPVGPLWPLADGSIRCMSLR